MQVLKPLAIEHVGLAPWHALDALSVDEKYFDTALLKEIIQWDPIHTRGLHRDDRDAAGC